MAGAAAAARLRQAQHTRPFVKLIESYRPDWTICTHFLPAEIIAWLRARLPVLAYKIDRLLDDPARLAAMRASVQRLARPQAARTIVETLRALDRHASPDLDVRRPLA